MAQVGNDGARASLDQLLAERGTRMTAADKANNCHPCRRGGIHAGGRILDHDTIAGLNPHPRSSVKEQVRRGLAIGHIAGGKLRVEKPN
jgi:hypothetical protein